MNVCMYVGMQWYAGRYVSMNVCLYVCRYAGRYSGRYVSMNVCLYVCRYVGMQVRMQVGM